MKKVCRKMFHPRSKTKNTVPQHLLRALYHFPGACGTNNAECSSQTAVWIFGYCTLIALRPKVRLPYAPYYRYYTHGDITLRSNELAFSGRSSSCALIHELFASRVLSHQFASTLPEWVRGARLEWFRTVGPWRISLLRGSDWALV